MEYQKVRINRQKMQFFMCPKFYVIIGPEDIDISHKLYLTAAWLAQLGERRSAEREVAGSNPGWTNTQDL